MNKEDYQELNESTVQNITGGLEAIERAEIDMQIATAKRYPRSLSRFKEKALEMATLDEETAESCIYRRPVGKEKVNGMWVQKYAEGKSVRLAEIVGACYENLRVGSMLVEMNDRYVKARGIAFDLQGNFAATSEVIESTVKSDGQLYSERMRVVIAKATLAKARRDATFMVVPSALCKTIEQAARKVAIGDEKTLAARRDRMQAWINLLGIDESRVFDAIGVKGIEDVGLEQLEMLTGIKTAIKDGDTTINEAFPANIDESAETEKLDKKLKIEKEEPKKQKKTSKPEAEAVPEKESEQSAGRFAQWSELTETDIRSAISEVMGKYKAVEAKLKARVGINNFGQLLKHFAIEHLNPRECTPETYWDMVDYLENQKGE